MQLFPAGSPTDKEILFNQTQIRLHFPFSYWIETKRTIVSFQINFFSLQIFGWKKFQNNFQNYLMFFLRVLWDLTFLGYKHVNIITSQRSFIWRYMTEVHYYETLSRARKVLSEGIWQKFIVTKHYHEPEKFYLNVYDRSLCFGNHHHHLYTSLIDFNKIERKKIKFIEILSKFYTTWGNWTELI